MVRVGRYNYEKSTLKGKKLMTEVNNKVVHFGDSSAGHFKDKTGIWSYKDHTDKQKRKLFLARAKGIKLKDGRPAWKDPYSGIYHSVKVLW